MKLSFCLIWFYVKIKKSACCAKAVRAFLRNILVRKMDKNAYSINDVMYVLNVTRATV